MKKALPVIAFLTVALIGSAGATFVWFTNERAERIRFEAIADDAVNRIDARMNRYMLLLNATTAFFEANAGDVSAAEFARFASQLDLETRHAGIAGLGFAPLMEHHERSAVMQAFWENYRAPLPLQPGETKEPFAAPVVFVETTDAEEPPAIGYDMYSDPDRREAMQAAAHNRAPHATAATRLIGDRDPAVRAFIVFAPLYVGAFGIEERIDRPQVPTGYVFAAFRAEELLSAALRIPPLLPIHMAAYDGRGSPSSLLYAYGDEPTPAFSDGYRVERTVQVAGREWTLVFRPTAAYRPSASQYLALILGAVSLLFAAALAASLAAQNRAHAATELLAQTMERNLVEKDLMLQEMKHRIKNSIARILAMARQTAARATSVEAFADTFTQRLQAMASAQDMLTRSKYQRADLRELLLRELGQVFGEGAGAAGLDGPPVSLDEAETQALGLTFHELATNALKYGGRADDGPDGALNGAPPIEVHWRLEPDRVGRRLVLVWQESGGRDVRPPEKTGFGTRLIDANIRLELGGDIRRDYRPSGIRIEISVPLGARPARKAAELLQPGARGGGASPAGRPAPERAPASGVRPAE